jgi:hypothetical protein
MYQLGPHWTDFRETCYLGGLLLKLWQENPNFVKNSGKKTQIFLKPLARKPKFCLKLWQENPNFVKTSDKKHQILLKTLAR